MSERETQTGGGRRRLVPLVLLGSGIAVLALGGFLLRRAGASTNEVALASQPKGATVVAAIKTSFRPERRYVGAIEPWVTARIGPQLVSAFVDTVLVRPGDRVHRGQVLATLDCRNTSALSRSIRMQAKALEATQAAISKQATRVGSLLEGGFVSSDEVEQKSAESQSKQAQVLALQAQLLGTELQQQDCVLRAPFEGEVAERSVDPGAFARPGLSVLTLVDRGTLRVTANVPESDFELVAPQRPVRLKLVATGEELEARISRRSPSADEGTRTVHLEIDLPNHDRRIPSGTTADVRVEAGEARPALEVPLTAASVRGEVATVMVVEAGKAHQRSVALIGERAGRLYLDPSLGAGAEVVTEGRAALVEGDSITTRKLEPAPAEATRPSAREGAIPSRTRTP